MIPTIFVFVLIGGLLLFEIVGSPIICKRKIKAHIEFIGGTLSLIERLSSRD